ncbi:alkaline phosphatase family protein [Salinibaculum rarum]|uniref:alkaline phosphatase family protein n=1 Tax=Salinibaculum rarum TaxID=3058903 RepID=UPI00265DED4B|nr:alkaline phosphatase family protein [Salinibaculum sp. KK48]
MRTIALGVDGMDPTLRERWVDAGELPNIRSLQEAGAFGRANCSSLISATQWTTHFTGVSPDRHGVTDFVTANEQDTGSTENPFRKEAIDHRKLITTTDIAVKTYPELLSEDGLAVGLINPLPIWPPLELDGGFCIAGMITPPDADKIVFPSSMKSELDKFGYQIDVRYGDRPYGFLDDALLEDNEIDLATLREDMFDVLEARIAFTKYAIKSKDLDVLYSLLKTMDIVQHAFWAHMDRDDPAFGDTILECYRKVDDLVGWIRETQPDANLVVFSDHGFGPRKDPASGRLHAVGSLVDSYVSVPFQLKSLYHRFLKSETEVDLSDLDRLSGGHRNPAAWAMAGPDIRDWGKIDIAFEDITPTLVALSGRPVPRAYVGEPVADALICEIDYRDVDLSVTREHREDVAGEVSDRLYNLGYADMVKEQDS